MIKLAIGLSILVILFTVAVILLVRGSNKDAFEDYHNAGDIGGG